MAHIIEEIDSAVAALCHELEMHLLNFFDDATLQIRRNYIIATGSYACGFWQHRDDIRLVCLIRATKSRYQEILREQLQIPEEASMPEGSEIELSNPEFSRGIDSGRGCLSAFATLRQPSKV